MFYFLFSLTSNSIFISLFPLVSLSLLLYLFVSLSHYFIHTHIHTYILTYLHTYIHTYKPTYINVVFPSFLYFNYYSFSHIYIYFFLAYSFVLSHELFKIAFNQSGSSGTSPLRYVRMEEGQGLPHDPWSIKFVAVVYRVLLWNHICPSKGELNPFAEAFINLCYFHQRHELLYASPYKIERKTK